MAAPPSSLVVRVRSDVSAYAMIAELKVRDQIAETGSSGDFLIATGVRAKIDSADTMATLATRAIPL